MNVIEDVKNLITNYKHHAIYTSSNEDLNGLFNYFRVQNKDVLTVLGSGDQAILSYLNGARSIDTFDKELYTYYCFYLRKWLIKYENIYIIDVSMNYRGLIDKVIPTSEDEADALLFWKILFEHSNYTMSDDILIRLHFLPSDFNVVPQMKENDIRKIDDLKFKFYNIDICKKVSLQKTYDVVILSNILEWDENQSYHEVMENLESLLNPGGIAVCSYLGRLITCPSHQEEIRQITSSKKIVFNEYPDVGYQYKKIR